MQPSATQAHAPSAGHGLPSAAALARNAAVTMTTAYGTKTFASVAAGTTVSHAFTTRQVSLPAGAVTVGATATIDGTPVSAEVSAPYAARPCA